MFLTHWDWVTHSCVGKLTSIGSDNGLSPGRCHAIIWTNAGILLIAQLGTNFSEIIIEIRRFSFKKMHLKMSSGKWWSFCLSLNMLKKQCWFLWWRNRMFVFIVNVYARGCFTNVSRALQNILSKFEYFGIRSSYENFNLKLCTCAQSILT